MAIITKDPHAWFVTESDDGVQTVYNNETLGHDYPFGFQVNFSDTPSPQTNTVTLYNLAKEHKDFYHRKQHCYVAFNWGKEKKILAEGFISKIDMVQHDGVTDTQVISFTEGTDYSNVKARKLKISKKRKSTSIRPSRSKKKITIKTRGSTGPRSRHTKLAKRKVRSTLNTTVDLKRCWSKVRSRISGSSTEVLRQCRSIKPTAKAPRTKRSFKVSLVNPASRYPSLIWLKTQQSSVLSLLKASH